MAPTSAAALLFLKGNPMLIWPYYTAGLIASSDQQPLGEAFKAEARLRSAKSL